MWIKKIIRHYNHGGFKSDEELESLMGTLYDQGASIIEHSNQYLLNNVFMKADNLPISIYFLEDNSEYNDLSCYPIDNELFTDEKNYANFSVDELINCLDYDGFHIFHHEDFDKILQNILTDNHDTIKQKSKNTYGLFCPPGSKAQKIFWEMDDHPDPIILIFVDAIKTVIDDNYRYLTSTNNYKKAKLMEMAVITVILHELTHNAFRFYLPYHHLLQKFNRKLIIESFANYVAYKFQTCSHSERMVKEVIYVMNGNSVAYLGIDFWTNLCGSDMELIVEYLSGFEKHSLSNKMINTSSTLGEFNLRMKEIVDTVKAFSIEYRALKSWPIPQITIQLRDLKFLADNAFYNKLEEYVQIIGKRILINAAEFSQEFKSSHTISNKIPFEEFYTGSFNDGIEREIWIHKKLLKDDLTKSIAFFMYNDFKSFNATSKIVKLVKVDSSSFGKFYEIKEPPFRIIFTHDEYKFWIHNKIIKKKDRLDMKKITKIIRHNFDVDNYVNIKSVLTTA